MLNRRMMMVSAAGALLATSQGSAQQPHWLVGTWKGEIGGNWNAKDGRGRTMVIAAVEPAGAVKGGWAALGNPKIGNAEFTLAGDNVKVVTTADSQIEMKRAADGRLTGQMRMMKSGKTYPIEMRRE